MRTRFASSLEAITLLKKTNGVKIIDNKITVAGNLGLKIWSAIDYLCNYHFYIWSNG